jgi:thiol-disulfide isomerase/thioredoxin
MALHAVFVALIFNLTSFIFSKKNKPRKIFSLRIKFLISTYTLSISDMKTFLLSVISFMLFCTVSMNAQIQWKEDTAIIAGKIENLEKHPDIFSVSLICKPVYDYDYNTRSVNLNPDGSFQFRIPVAYPQEVYLQLKELFRVLVIPGDSLFVKINADFLNDSLGIYSAEEFIDFKGGALARDNQLITIFTKEIGFLFNQPLIKKICKEDSPDIYRKYIDVRTDSCLKFLDEFRWKFHPSDRFIAFAQDDIKYRRLKNLLKYWRSHASLNNQKSDSARLVPPEYFIFLKEYNPEDFSIISNDHSDFLHEYYMYSINFPFEDRLKLKDYYKSGPARGCIKKTEMILKNSSGSTRNILLTKRFLSVLAGKDLALFDSVYTPGIITDPWLTARVDKAYLELKEFLADKKTDPGSRLNPAIKTKPNATFDTLIARYKGKVIYIDFWAPWCGPCMGEMPASRDLQTQFLGKDVVFLYLGNNCKEDAWESTVANAKIPGEHYLLNKGQYNSLAALFNFSGIPHYVLVDRKGGVTDINAPRPSDKEHIIKMINELLSESQ